MLSYNEIKEKTYILYEQEPWEVITSQVTRKQANKPVNRTKIKNLISGRLIEHTFHASDKVDEADIGSKKIQYIYNNKGEYWFHDEGNPSNRFSLSENILGDKTKFIKENSLIDTLTFTLKDEEKIIGIKIPIKVELKVIEAPPAVKGDTSSGGTKQITLETGTIINAPLFINEGDIIRVNTETGEYSERA